MPADAARGLNRATHPVKSAFCTGRRSTGKPAALIGCAVGALPAQAAMLIVAQVTRKWRLFICMLLFRIVRLRRNESQ
jgi:chromate transport protein ChrA